MPFNLFLKQYFSQHKKYGSADRRNISQLCYSFFRTGHALEDKAVGDKIILSLFLTESKPGAQLSFHRPDLVEKVALPLNEKLEILGLTPGAIFPYQSVFGNEIESVPFILSHLIQPRLFIRCRPGMADTVINKLKAEKIPFEKISDDCLSLDNATKINTLIQVNKDAVIQDMNSQRVAELLKLIPVQDHPLKAWDACAASGGKSILAYDVCGIMDLTVTDIRKTSLVNLEKRFSEAGIKNYKSFTADVSKPVEELHGKQFDLVLADVPCSGSGTWSRTPEQLYFFTDKSISGFSSLQTAIVQSVIPHVRPGGYFLYITCSVFKNENEDIVATIKETCNMEPLAQKYFRGYDKKADTLFAALFKRP